MGNKQLATSKPSEIAQQSSKSNIINSQNCLSKLHIFGLNSNSDPEIVLFDPLSQNIHSYPAPKNMRILNHMGVVLITDRLIYLSGGINKECSDISNELIEYDPTANSFSYLHSMHHSRYTHCLAHTPGRLYALGGRTYGEGMNGLLSTCEMYNFSTRTWTQIGQLNQPRCTFFTFVYQEMLFVCGGFSGNKHRVDTIERYNQQHDKWEIIQMKLNKGVECGNLHVLGGTDSPDELLILGGNGKDGGTDECWVHNLAKNTSRLIGNMNNSRVLGKSVVGHDQRIYVLGGDQPGRQEIRKEDVIKDRRNQESLEGFEKKNASVGDKGSSNSSTDNQKECKQVQQIKRVVGQKKGLDEEQENNHNLPKKRLCSNKPSRMNVMKIMNEVQEQEQNGNGVDHKVINMLMDITQKLILQGNRSQHISLSDVSDNCLKNHKSLLEAAANNVRDIKEQTNHKVNIPLISQTIERTKFLSKESIQFETIESDILNDFFKTHPYRVWKGYSHALPTSIITSQINPQSQLSSYTLPLFQQISSSQFSHMIYAFSTNSSKSRRIKPNNFNNTSPNTIQYPFIGELNTLTNQYQALPKPKGLKLYCYSGAVRINESKAIFLCGGVNESMDNITNSTYMYYPGSNQIQILPSMSVHRYAFAILKKGDNIYVFGGRTYGKDSLGVLSVCERYNLRTNTWQNLPSMHFKRCSLMTVQIGQNIIVAGGYNGNGKRLDSMECFVESSMKWEVMGMKLSDGIEGGVMMSIFNSDANKDELIVFGGRSNNKDSQIVSVFQSQNGMECFDSYVEKVLGNLPESRCLHKIIPIMRKGQNDQGSLDNQLMKMKDDNMGFIVLGGYTKGKPIEIIEYDKQEGENKIVLHKDCCNNTQMHGVLIDSLNQLLFETLGFTDTTLRKHVVI